MTARAPSRSTNLWTSSSGALPLFFAGPLEDDRGMLPAAATRGPHGESEDDALTQIRPPRPAPGPSERKARGLVPQAPSALEEVREVHPTPPMGPRIGWILVPVPSGDKPLGGRRRPMRLALPSSEETERESTRLPSLKSPTEGRGLRPSPPAAVAGPRHRRPRPAASGQQATARPRRPTQAAADHGVTDTERLPPIQQQDRGPAESSP